MRVSRLRLLTRLTCVFSLWVFLLSCAQVEAPSGGPPDKSAPRVAGIYPAQQSTEVNTQFEAIIEFNEWIDSRVNFKHAHVSPPLTKPLQLRADGNRLYINTVDSLDPNTTYTITLSTSIQDLRGNSMTQPFSLTFSTGPTLDSLKLDGLVTAPKGRSAPQATIVGLYPLEGQRQELNYLKALIDSTTPEVGSEPLFYKEKPMYMTEVDTNGYFSFQGLRAGKYRIISFVDQNTNRLVELNQEQVALFSSDINLETEHYPITLSLASLDTSGLELLQASSSKDNQVLLTFNHAPHWPSSQAPQLYQLQSSRDTLWSHPALVYPHPKTSMPILQFDTLIPDLDYQIQVGALQDSNSRLVDTLSQEQAFTALLDTTQARVLHTQPLHKSSGVQTLDTMILYFDRPIQSKDWQDQLLYVSNGDTLDLQVTQLAPHALNLTPAQGVGAGTEIRVYKTYADTTLSVNAQNTLDTNIDAKSSLVLSFSTIDPLKVTQLKGSLPQCDLQTQIRIYRGNQEHLTQCDETGHFLFKEVEAGPWLLESYQDLNANKQRDLGQLIPFQYSEPYYQLADTLFLKRDSINILDSLLKKASP